MPKTILFDKSTALAIRGNDKSDFWIGLTVQPVRNSAQFLKIRWLELLKKSSKIEIYSVQSSILERIPIESVIKPIDLKVYKSKTKVKVKQYVLSKKERGSIVKTRRLLDEGKGSNFLDDSGTFSLQPLLQTEKGSSKTESKRVRDPNRRFKINSSINVYEKDPFFETKEPLPFISTSIESKLLFRAILTDDFPYFKELVENKDTVSSLTIKESVDSFKSPLSLAIQKNKYSFVSLLLSDETAHMPRAKPPISILQDTSNTGSYNPRSLYVKCFRSIRVLSGSRGGKEGNTALNQRTDESPELRVFDSEIYEWNVEDPRIVTALQKARMLSSQETLFHFALLWGRRQKAIELLKDMSKEEANFSGLSHFHSDALTFEEKDSWSYSPREISVIKASRYSKISPIHAACLNPNVNVLKELFAIHPNLYVRDSKKRTLIHYAVCNRDNLSTIEFLVSRNASLSEPDKNGNTPLMIACQIGNLPMVDFLLVTLTSSSSFSGKFGVGGINMTNKDSYTALHLAVEKNEIQVVEKLCAFGADVNKRLSINHRKISALMMASRQRNLPLVKFLIQTGRARMSQVDSFKRTALMHAVLNGASNVVSFFLYSGMDPNGVDSSGNSLLHYACAYGHFFCVKILLEAGARLDLQNDWKLTPLAAAVYKGHSGLIKGLLSSGKKASVDYEDDEGRTICMNLIRSSTLLTENVFENLKNLLNYGSNVSKIDTAHQNALHYLCINFKGIFDTETHSDFVSRVSLTTRALKLLVEGGASPFTLDTKGHWPLSYLLLQKGILGKSYELIFTLLEIMESLQSKTNKKNNNKNEIQNIQNGSTFNSILNSLSSSLDLLCIEREKEILDKVAKLLSGHNKENFVSESSLHTLIETYINFPEIKRGSLISNHWQNTYERFTSLHPSIIFEKSKRNKRENENGNGNEESKISESFFQQQWRRARDFIRAFITIFSPSLTYRKTNAKGKESIISTLPILLLTPSFEPRDEHFLKPGFELLFEYDSEIDVRNSSETPLLAQIIIESNLELFDLCLSHGANKNSIFPFEHSIITSLYAPLSYKSISYISPLILTVLTSQTTMFTRLLECGANVRNPSCVIKNDEKETSKEFCQPLNVLILAVLSSLREPSNSMKMSIVKSLTHYHIEIYQNDISWMKDSLLHGNNIVHILVNESNDDPNQNLELLIFFLQQGGNASEKNAFGRCPLYYAFRKMNNENKTNSIDPIDVTSLIISSMNQELISETDSEGSSLLHYAAYRGATVCCLLLLQKGANIDALDNLGNTPISYSILNNHMSATIMLLQKGANVNHFIHFHPSSPLKSETTNPFQFFCPESLSNTKKPISLFEGVVLNSWLGVVYLLLERLELHGMSIAFAIDVAFRLHKYQFARSLISKQYIQPHKLRETVSGQRNLIGSLAFNAPRTTSSSDNDVLTEILTRLLEANLSPIATDEFDCTPLHHALRSGHEIIVKGLLSQSSVLEHLNDEDKFGRAPIFHSLWYKDFSLFPLLLSKGVKVNILGYLPSLHHAHKTYEHKFKGLSIFSSFSNSLSCKALKEGSQRKISPLIAAIVFGNERMVEELLRFGADVNFPDEIGMTPLMHATRSQNLSVLQTLVSHTVISSIKETKKSKKSRLISIDYNAEDFEGFSALHHSLFYNETKNSSYNNEAVLSFLLNLGVEFRIPTSDLMRLSLSLGAYQISDFLSKRFSLPKNNLSFPLRYKPSLFSSATFDVASDARSMFEILKNSSFSSSEKKKDRNILYEVPSGLSLKSPRLFDDYTIILSKVSFCNSSDGLYNFYRMSIWKDSVKSLFVLYTNWGRFGDEGQFQNTPYGSADDAINEFKKIFLAKSGNIWENRKNFVIKDLKYRLLSVFDSRVVYKKQLAFDLTSSLPSLLPEDVQSLLKDALNVNMIREAYKALGIDSEALPFGYLDARQIEKARDLLKTLLSKIKKYHTHHHESKEEKEDKEKKIESETESEKKKKIEEEREKKRKNQLLNSIYSLSSEYFHLMPKRNKSCLDLSPLDTEKKIEREMSIVENMLEFELTERLLLGAQYRRESVNPLDYVYEALQVEILPLDSSHFMVPYLLEYMYNSRQAKTLKVLSIYQITTASYFTPSTLSFLKKEPHLPTLLWHGTQSENLLSILHRGLNVKPPSQTHRSGSTFGKGIYTSNVFEKSLSYTSKSFESNTYMLLCNVYLGKTLTYAPPYPSVTPSEQDFLSDSNYDSLTVAGKESPEISISLSSMQILPIGKLNKTPSDWSYYNYDEFVVYQNHQVDVQYLFRIQ